MKRYSCYIRTDKYRDIEPVFCIISSTQSAVQVRSWLKKLISKTDNKNMLSVGRISELSEETFQQLGPFSPALAITALEKRIEKYKREEFKRKIKEKFHIKKK